MLVDHALPDPNHPANGIEGPALVFSNGHGHTGADFERLALIAEPLDDVHPTVPSSCHVQEAILSIDPSDAVAMAVARCTSDADCQGNRTCDATLSPASCAGHAGAACCSHVSPGACLANDGYCSVCMPSTVPGESLAIGSGDGHTFRLRSKQFPTMCASLCT